MRKKCFEMETKVFRSIITFSFHYLLNQVFTLNSIILIIISQKFVQKYRTFDINASFRQLWQPLATEKKEL